MAANNVRSADVESAEKRTILQQLAQLEMKYEAIMHKRWEYSRFMQGARIRKRTGHPCVQ